MLHIICAWCSKVMQEGDKTQKPSHGICPSCEQGVLEQNGGKR